MRISDWSSDVCSSDLIMHFHYRAARELDRQVEAPYNDEGHRRDKGQQADQVEQQRMPHERDAAMNRSEEHTSELQSLMRISYAVFCLKKQIYNINTI